MFRPKKRPRQTETHKHPIRVVWRTIPALCSSLWYSWSELQPNTCQGAHALLSEPVTAHNLCLDRRLNKTRPSDGVFSMSLTTVNGAVVAQTSIELRDANLKATAQAAVAGCYRAITQNAALHGRVQSALGGGKKKNLKHFCNLHHVGVRQFQNRLPTLWISEVKKRKEK